MLTSLERVAEILDRQVAKTAKLSYLLTFFFLSCVSEASMIVAEAITSIHTRKCVICENFIPLSTYSFTTIEKFGSWIYNFTWKSLNLWWLFFVNNKVLCFCTLYRLYIFPSASPPTSLLSSYQKKKKRIELKRSTNQTKLEWHHNTFTQLYMLCHLANYAYYRTFYKTLYMHISLVAPTKWMQSELLTPIHA